MTDAVLPARGQDAAGRLAARQFYAAIWRWHFYAGLYVAPFLIMLAVTGLIMLWVSALHGREGGRIAASAGGAAQSAGSLARAAEAVLPGARAVEYVAPLKAGRAALFGVEVPGETPEAEAIRHYVALDPVTGTVLQHWPQPGLYDLATEIHGTLLLGDTGDRLIEIAASLGMVLIATGLFLWWPREGRASLLPDLAARGRMLMKSLHQVVGFWTALILTVFLLTGLSWAGIWGSKLVQAWSTFPAEKWDNVPLSDQSHASMNHGAAKEVPWALEQTPLPASGSAAGTQGAALPVSLDSVTAWAEANGFGGGRYRVAIPGSPEGVWTVSRDSMSNDSEDPTSDRTVHLDQYTGRVLADVGFADYAFWGQVMAVGIAFHEGDLGAWNLALNTLFCLAIIGLSVSGLVMWWQRRPAKALRLVAPSMPPMVPLYQGAALLALALSLMFPMAGLTLIAVLACDWLIIRRIRPLRRFFA